MLSVQEKAEQQTGQHEKMPSGTQKTSKQERNLLFLKWLQRK